MRKKKLIPALALTLALLCGISIGAGASSTLQEVKAFLNFGVTIKYNGQEQTLMNPDGSRLYPINYGGVNYLPVRAVSDMLGIGVGWDGSTQTINLGKQPSGVDLFDTYSVYHIIGDRRQVTQVKTADGKTEDIAGVTQNHWLAIFCNWYDEKVVASFNLLGKHDTLTFSYYADKDGFLTLTGDDGRLLGEYPLTGGAVPKTVTLPLARTNELKFEVTPIRDKNGRGTTSPNVRIFDAYLDAEQ